ncbi:MAG: hypothetical protein Q8942_17050 [Bacillota bacterium]|nr:hypothetical protein [Bacillota bacterium]
MIYLKNIKGVRLTFNSKSIDIDIMLEAENKELALLKLSQELKTQEWIRTINESEFEA